MKRRLYAPAVILIGLVSAQIVATAHVYLSNLDLLQAVGAMRRSGYLAVPNGIVADGLSALTTAMAGGLFFTLSIGAGLSLAALVTVWLWDRVFRRRLRDGALCALTWLGAIIAVNSGGWNLVATAYLLVVPGVTGTAAVMLMPARTTLLSPRGVVWPVAAAAILALLWSLVADTNLFTNVRDHLLLANPVGRLITTAYYDYTLYPAEAFKSLTQKQLRTCNLDPALTEPNLSRIERIVRSHDYLPVPSGFPADLTILPGGGQAALSLTRGHDRVMEVTDRTFFETPEDVLAHFSGRLDHNRAFRLLTLGCLLLGLPLVLFTLLFSTLSLLPDLLMTMAASNAVAALLCIVVGVSLLSPVYRGRNALAAPAVPAGDLAAAPLPARIAWLRQAAESGRDTTGVALTLDMAHSASIAERYWLARSLAGGAHPDAGRLLETLADDPATIVACQALWAMGKRNNRQMIPWIIARINTSSDWYFQMYAYRTLRTLGWVQPRSPFVSR